MTVKVAKAGVTKTPTPKPTSKTTPKPTATVTTTPNPTPAATPTPTPIADTTFKNGDVTMTVSEKDTHSIPLTELNETIMTSESKRPPIAEGEKYARADAIFNRDGSVTFTSNADYNSGMSFYINPCTKDSDLTELTDTRGDGFFNYRSGAKDMSAYDYIRIKVTSDVEMNLRTYTGIESLEIGGALTDSKKSEVYEGGWIGPASADVYMEEDGGVGKKVKDDQYVTRTLFIPLESLIAKTDLADLAAITFCPQRKDTEVTIHSIDFVKVKYDTQVTGITVTAEKTELENGKSAKCAAAVAPAAATRKMVKWTSSNPELATVDFTGKVTAAATGTGTVTISAEATDGSETKGTVQITVVEPAEEGADTDITVPLTEAAKYGEACLEDENGTCTPLYGNDGSVTYTSSNQYNGGGMAFYFKADKEAVNLSKYAGIEVVIEGTNGKPIKLTAFTDEETDNVLNAGKIADDYGLTLNGNEQKYFLDFSKTDANITKWGNRGNAYALGIMYSGYNESQGEGNSYDEGNKLYCNIKVKSVKLVKEAVNVPLTNATKYSEGCLENSDGSTCEPEYGTDGSVKFTSSNQNNGGGMAFYFNTAKEAVDLSKYKGIKVVINGTAGKEIKLTAFTAEEPDNYLFSEKLADDYGLTLNGSDQEYILNFESDANKWGSRGDAYALGIMYNAYNENQAEAYDEENKKYCEITVKSVEFLKEIPASTAD